MCKHLTQNTKKTCSRKLLKEYKVPNIAGDVEIAACLCVPRMWDIEAGIANGTMQTDQAAHRLRAVTLFWNERTSNIFCKCDDIITFDNTQGHAVVASALLLRALIAQQPTLQVRSPEYTPTSPPLPLPYSTFGALMLSLNASCSSMPKNQPHCSPPRSPS